MIQSKVMTTAHQIKEIYKTWPEALKMAWQIEKFKKELLKGDVNFKFLKKSGEERAARGTTKRDSFNYDFKGSKKKTNPHIIKYFDLDKNNFRSFDIRRIITA